MKYDIDFKNFANIIDSGNMDRISRSIRGVDLKEKPPARQNPFITIAVSTGNTRIVDLLLKNGVSINDKNSVGQDALFEAVRREDVNMVKFLIKKGISVLTVADKETAFSEAVMSGAYTCAQEILKHNPDVEFRYRNNSPIIDEMESSRRFKKFVKEYRAEEEEKEFLKKTKKLGKYRDLLR